MRPANCPNCHGNGRVLDESRPVTEYDLPQYRNCAYCGGSGFDMPPWDYREQRGAERYNPDGSSFQVNGDHNS